MSNAWLITKAAVIAMMATYLFSMAAIVEQAQWWVILFGGVCVVWRAAMLYGKAGLLKSRWRTVLTLVMIALLTLTAKQMGLLNAMVNLLLLGYGLKFIELNKQRDALVLPLVGLLCVCVMFIYSSGLGSAIIGFFLLVLNLSVLVAVFAPSLRLSNQLKLSLKIVGLSIPLTTVLFVVMPQLSPLWKMPTAKNATVGLSDSMSPGDIARLGQDDTLAFSVTFDEQRPLADQLYWRALVMEEFDGRRWQKSQLSRENQRLQQLNYRKPTQVGGADGIRYQVMAKASNQSWLFGLARPTSSDKGIIETDDLNLLSSKPLASSKAYNVVSYPSLMAGVTLSPLQKHINLAVPRGTNLKTKQWVAQLRHQYNDQELIDYVLAYFNKNPYAYTLTPPPLGRDSVDEFLFSTQQGFCAHYASAFSLIMRYAGIPSRVVAGYLGGEWNEEVGYLNVYQYDAHAWNEVWLEGRGWVRVDPTASVAPERVEQGLAGSLDNQRDFLSDSTISLAKYRNIAWLNALRTKMANAEYYWSRWLLGYDKTKQNQLLSKILGKLTPTKLIVFTISCLALVGTWLLFAGGFRFKRLTMSQKVDRLYLQLVLACEKQGVKRENHHTPNQFLQLVSQRSPQLSNEMEQLTSQYNYLRFVCQDAITTNELAAFKKRVQRLLKKI